MTAEDWKRRSVYRKRFSVSTPRRKYSKQVNKTNLEVLRNFTDKPLEGQLADEELGRLLVPTDLAERDGTGAETVRLLYTAGRGGRGLARRLGSELLTGRLA